MSEELPPPFSTPMPEDRRGRLELFNNRAEAFEKLVNERQAAAEARGRQLLLSMLDDTQRAQLETEGAFHVVGSEGGLFEINIKGNSGNVALITPPKPPFREPTRLISFCAHYEAQPDPFLYPYIRTLKPPGVNYCCPGCNGLSYEQWVDALTERELGAGWPDEFVRQQAKRHLCQSDLMIGQMLKIRVDEVGWCDVAVPCVRDDYSAAEAYMRRVSELRTQRSIEQAVGKKVADFGVEGAIAAGPLTIRIRDHYTGAVVTRTVRVTEDGSWVVADPEPAPAWGGLHYGRVQVARWDDPEPRQRVVVAPWDRAPQVDVQVDNREALARLRYAARGMAELTEAQRATLRNLMGR